MAQLEFLTPSPALAPQDMVQQEIKRLEMFRASGFKTPSVIVRMPTAIVLTDVGKTVDASLRDTRDDRHHDDLLIICARELGRLHAAGLCHGRPHPRDFVFSGSELVYLDFEEAAEEAMPQSLAQARDIWIFLLQISMRVRLGSPTLDGAYAAWAELAPLQAKREISTILKRLRPWAGVAKLLSKLHGGRDIQRFISIMDYFETLHVDQQHGPSNPFTSSKRPSHD
ncbi:MAG: hypothetical protein QM636_09280 [Rhizobium sp.]